MLEASPLPATLLLDVNLARLLGAFREPRTAAEAARALGEPANRTNWAPCSQVEGSGLAARGDPKGTQSLFASHPA